jgi:hypothetical protein
MAKVLFCKGNYFLAQGSRGKRKGGKLFFSARFGKETQRRECIFKRKVREGKAKEAFLY